MQPFEFLLGLSQVARVGNRIALAVSQEFLESQINASLFASWDVLHAPICLDHDLNEVSICAANETHPFDLITREGFDVAGANEPEPPDVAAIGEADMSTV
jgi:hypothetical protein